MCRTRAQQRAQGPPSREEPRLPAVDRTPAFGVHRYSTDDADEGHHFIHEAYVDVEVRVDGRPDRFRLVSDTVQVGTSTINRLQHSMAVGMNARDGVGWQCVFQSRRPTIGVDAGRRQFRLGAGEALALRPGVPYTCAWDSLDADIVNLDLRRAADQAEAAGELSEPFHFDFDVAISPVAADHWRRTVDLVRRVGLANARRPDGALLADQLERLLAGAALVCFPSNANRDGQPPTRTSPASLRRAVAYVEDHLDQPVLLADIAAAARVSPRALNLTFNWYLGTSPMGYVRRVRLDRAAHDLRDAQPGDGTTVGAVAACWGFLSPSRFGTLYRAAYGRRPSDDLRND